MNYKYYPTLIIGAGGTGVKTLRFIQSFAESKQDLDLKAMLDAGSIQLVGIDTDRKSNDQESAIDQNLLKIAGLGEESGERPPERLARLSKNWVHMDSTALNHALPRVHQYTSLSGIDGNTSPDLPLRSIHNWFPMRDEKTGNQITMGHSKLSGAAQWRPLGRMSLFLNAQRIYQALEKAFKHVKQSDPEQGPVRAYIVSSLAGGTGSGIFWDLAFMLQLLDPNTRTSGMFLLGDPFESVDEAGRIFPNIYAALKEIGTYKNWKEPWKVEYPFGRTFHGKPDAPLAFDMVYLYQSFTPGADVTDRDQATIDVSCLRLGQNLLALSRRDLFKALDVAANNMDSDTTSMASDYESSYCFSTTGSTVFNLRSAHILENYVVYQTRMALLPDTNLMNQPLTADDLLGLLDLPHGGDGESGDPFTDMRKEILTGIDMTKPGEITDTITRIDEAIAALDRQDANIDEIIRDKLGDKILDDLKGISRNLPSHVTICNLDHIFGDRLSRKLEDRLEVLDDRIHRIKTRARYTDSEGERLLGRLADIAGNLLDIAEKAEYFRVLVPESFHQVRYQIGENTPPVLARIHRMGQRILRRPNTSRQDTINNLRTFLEDFKSKLLGQGEVDMGKLEPVLKIVWNRHRDKIRERFESLLSCLQDHKKRLTQRTATIRELEKEIKMEPVELGQSDIEQLGELYRAIAPPPNAADRNRWIEKHEPEILARIRDFYPRHLNRLNDSQKRNLINESLKGFADALEKQFERKTKQAKPYYLNKFIAKCLGEPNLLREQGAIQAIADNTAKAARAVVNYWNAQSNLMIQGAGGEHGLRMRLYRCKSDLFNDGVIENRINKKHLVTMPYNNDNRDVRAEDKTKLKETFEILAQEVIGTRAHVSDQETDKPVIFYNDLFRSAEEISRIRDYYKAYNDSPNKTFFHVDRNIAGAREVVGEAIEIQPVNCGNEGCKYNIRNLDRVALICPGCKSPIWNRCGNRTCVEDELVDLIAHHQAASQTPGARPPWSCPACQGDLKTYWWTCKEEGHNDKIPTDKETCPTCLAQYHEGARRHRDVHRRQDLGDLECPGCINMSDPPGKYLTKIPAQLRRFYDKGVNGHDSLHFRKLITHYKTMYPLAEHVCTNVGREHFLFPTCPEGARDPDRRHHLCRNQTGKFVCPRHPRKKFSQCYHCDYPISLEENLYGCPRCLRPVRHCAFCSDKYQTLYAPMDDVAPDRCPRCCNLMTAQGTQDQELVESNLAEPAFCTNIYACQAGSGLWGTATEYELNKCEVCPDGHSAPLLPRAEMIQIVEGCPICSLVLSPIMHNGEQKYRGGEDIFHTFQDRFKGHSDTEQRSCLICGVDPVFALSWMCHDQFIPNGCHPKRKLDGKVVPMSEGHEGGKEGFADFLGDLRVEPEKLPKVPFSRALEYLTILRDHLNDAEAFNALKRTMGIQAVLNMNAREQEQLINVFPRKSRVARILRGRLQGLWQHADELRGRTRDWMEPKD